MPEARHDSDDPVGQVARNAKLVQGGVEVGRGAVEMRVTDAQAAVRPGEVWSPVALRTPKSFAEQRDHIAPVHMTIPGNIATFTDYLAGQGLLAPGSAPGAVLRRAAMDAAGEFVAAMGDPANFGMAKSIFGAALADGADITDADELEAWMTRFNAMSDGERDAILAGAAVGMGGLGARQQPPRLPPVVLPPDEVIEASKAPLRCWRCLPSWRGSRARAAR